MKIAVACYNSEIRVYLSLLGLVSRMELIAKLLVRFHGGLPTLLYQLSCGRFVMCFRPDLFLDVEYLG
jgi:hypothetical protein